MFILKEEMYVNIDVYHSIDVNTNIAMNYEQIGEGKFKVNGRGELQITILAENMRREGFELNVSVGMSECPMDGVALGTCVG